MGPTALNRLINPLWDSSGSHSILQFDITPMPPTVGLDGGTIVTAPSGEVTVPNIPTASPTIGDSMLREMVLNTNFFLEIMGQTAAYLFKAGKPLIADGGGTTLGPLVTNSYTMVRVVYDTAGCGTGIGSPGYSVVGATGTLIDSPPDVYLFHELVHAYHHMKGDFDLTKPELQAVAGYPGENDYRAARTPVLPARTTGPKVHDGFANCRIPAAPTPPMTPAPAPGTGGCFPASAAVLTPQGSCPIGMIEAGSFVLSYDSKRARLRQRVVSRKLTHAPERVWRISLQGTAAIDTTVEHSFLTKRGWVRTKKLKAGDEIVTAPAAGGKKTLRVACTADTGHVEPVYNLRTVGEHNFIVDGGVAHNFSSFRGLRQLWHRLFVDPFVAVAGGVPQQAYGNFGDPNEGNEPFDPNSWYYTVTITNDPANPSPVDFKLFFQRKNVTGLEFREINGVAVGSRAVFALCSCDQFVSYAFGVFVGDEMVGSAPGDLENDPPIDSTTKADGQPCADSWIATAGP